MNQQREDNGLLKSESVMGIIAALGYPWALLMTIPGTAGKRHVGGMKAIFGFGLMLLWAGLGHSEPLLILWCVCLLVQLRHRVATARSKERIHTWYAGDPGMLRKQPPVRGHMLWAAIGLFLWVVLHEADPALATWCGASGVCGLFGWSFALMRDRAIQDDLEDAKIEAEYRAGRMRPDDDEEGGWR